MSEMTPSLNEAEKIWQKKYIKEIEDIIDKIIKSRESLRPKDFPQILKKLDDHG